jgi:predicted Kef-type K+ transport protein
VDFEWVAIALGDVSWIALAFLLGLLARLINLPPLVGFLAAGFVLNYLGLSSGEMLQKLADLGITLLLFTVGLKLNVRELIRPQVWAVTALHVSIIVTLFGGVIFMVALTGLPLFRELDFKLSLMLAFALSFSSTVFVVKSLEARGAMKSLHGGLSIGILVMQDIAAVIFLAASTGKVPTWWALLLLLLIPLRRFIHSILTTIGHGELLVLFGLVLALGGAEVFELVGVKDDLGALIMGVLISSHPKAIELFKSMMSFKDLFLVGFFLTIGMTGQLTQEAFIIGLLLVPFLLVKSALLFALMTKFKLRARTALLSTLNLSNYSEFGLIVAAIGVSNGWLNAEWLVVIAIALSISFVLAAPLIRIDDRIYARFRPLWLKFQQDQRLADDRLLDAQGSTIAVFGMGRVGSGAYENMFERYGDTVVGIDFDIERVKHLQENGRKVLHGDPSDTDFWEKLDSNHNIELVMLALPNLRSNLEALMILGDISFPGRIAAIAKFPDEVDILKEAGATAVYNIYTEAGAGFANHVEVQNSPDDMPVKS